MITFGVQYRIRIRSQSFIKPSWRS